jgi:hypothetical protein
MLTWSSAWHAIAYSSSRPSWHDWCFIIEVATSTLVRRLFQIAKFYFSPRRSTIDVSYSYINSISIYRLRNVSKFDPEKFKCTDNSRVSTSGALVHVLHLFAETERRLSILTIGTQFATGALIHVFHALFHFIDFVKNHRSPNPGSACEINHQAM